MRNFGVAVVAILLLGYSWVTFGQSEVVSANAIAGPDPISQGQTFGKPSGLFGLQSNAALTAAARQSGTKVLMTIRQYDINETSLDDATRKLLTEKFTVGDPPTQTNLQLMPTEEILTVIDEIVAAGAAAIVSEGCMTLEFEREGGFYEGHIVDLAESEKQGRVIKLVTSKDGQLSPSDVELLKSPNNRFLGLSTTATAGISDDHELILRVMTRFTTLNSAPRKGEKYGFSTQMCELAGMKIGEGQSVASYWPAVTRHTTQITRVPGLGSIPVIGSRIFASRKLIKEDHRLLIAITPECVDPKK